MDRKIRIDHWKEADGGFRSSFLLKAAAVFVVLGAVMDTASKYLLTGTVDAAHPLIVLAWTFWIGGLWILGLGFAWVATGSLLSWFGMVPGLVHLAQGTYFLIILFTFSGPLFPPTLLTIARLLSVLAFAIIERDWIGRRSVVWLLSGTGLQLAKIILRQFGVEQALPGSVQPAIDGVILVIQAIAFFHLGRSIRREEDAWARDQVRDRTLDFESFNNPEHEWNKAPSSDADSGRDRPSA
jgi:hypothetical protein